MWEIGDIIKYRTFNGEIEAEIAKQIDEDNYLCRLKSGKFVIVNYNSFIF